MVDGYDMPAYVSTYILPLLYAVVLGGAIGLEREWHGRPAGLRTHVIVCLSSTMLILVSQGMNADRIGLGEAGRLVLDPNRMGAGIVTGIGFLGAATVLRSGDLLRGLTTAACIWFVAGLGIVLGNGNYVLGGSATLIVLIVLTVMNKLTHLMTPIIYRRLIVLTKRTDLDALMREVRGVLKEEKLRVHDVASGFDRREELGELVFYASLKNEHQMPHLTERVMQLNGVDVARWKLINTPS